MAQQEDGWPLGLRLLNARVGFLGNRDFSGSISFNTLLTRSPTSFTDSSDLDSESSGSFFHDKSISLGNLMGVSSIVEISRRSSRERRVEGISIGDRKNYYKPKPWLFSLCCKLSTDAVNVSNNAPSLSHFLEVERRRNAAASAFAANYRRNQRQSPMMFEMGINNLITI